MFRVEGFRVLGLGHEIAAAGIAVGGRDCLIQETSAQGPWSASKPYLNA